MAESSPTHRLLAGALAAGVLTLAAAACGGDGRSLVASVTPGPDVNNPNDPGDPDLPEGGTPLPPPAPTPTPTPSPSPSPGPSPVAGTNRLCFSPKEDCVAVLLPLLRAETEAIDMAIYHLYDSRISQILVAKQQAGVRVRVIADRFAYTIKPQHQREMDFLAVNGVPVRTNRHRGIVHHKATLLYSQGLVLHGSMNYTSVASRKVDFGGQTQWNEEVAFFTTNPDVFARFKERFDRMWANAGDGTEAFQLFTAGMTLPGFGETEANRPTTCYENPDPDPKPVPDDPGLKLCFAPDQNCNKDVVAPIISKESRRLDFFMFRITVNSVGDPLIAKVKAGLPIRMIMERSQYNNPLYPSMTQIVNDMLAANTAGNLQIRSTAHPGSMHMKSVITPDLATWGSGNFTNPSSRFVRGCQSLFYQDEDMAITRDQSLVATVQQRFDEMWGSPDFAPFDPTTAGGGGSTE